MRGRNISNKNIAEIVKFLETFETETQKQKRDYAILYYAYIENMTSMRIAALKDERIVGFGNRNKSFLSNVSIDRILKDYNLVYEKKHERIVPSKRLEWSNIIRKVDRAAMRCVLCGSKENIEIHHMIPLFMGGTNDNINLVPLCHCCHKKTHAYISEVVRNGNDTD